MTDITRQQVLAKLRDAVTRVGGPENYARLNGVTRSYVNQVLADKAVGETLIRNALGLERVRDLWTVAK